MPREGSLIFRSGSFEAEISSSEGNILIGHSGSIKFVDAASGSVAELTSSLSGSQMQTEWILGERSVEKPFWVFKPDGKMQYSRGGTGKVTEIDMSEKFLISSRSSHDAAEKFEHYEVQERAATEEKAKVKGGENTYDKGILISGSSPFISLFKTTDSSITKIQSDTYFYASSSFPWNIGMTVHDSNQSYFGGNNSIGLNDSAGGKPGLFWVSASGDWWMKGEVSSSSNISGSFLYSTNDTKVNRDLYVGRYVTLLADNPVIQYPSGVGNYLQIQSDTNGGTTVKLKDNTHGSSLIMDSTVSGRTKTIFFADAGTNKHMINMYASNLEMGGTDYQDGILTLSGSSNAHGAVGINMPNSSTDVVPKALTVVGDISASGEYFGKWKTTATYAFYVNSNSAVFAPIGGTLIESTGDSYYHRNIAPYDGRLVRAMVSCQNADPGTVQIGLTTGSGALGMSHNTGEICSVASCVDDTAYTFDFTGSSATFNKGEDIGISFKQENATNNGVYITAVWEYDTGGQ